MISTQDFDRLSEYLDGALSPKEKAAIELRLAQETELKAAFDDLRRMQHAFRDLPRLKPPRHFTLTAQQAQSIRRPSIFSWQLFPALRLATAVAALAFVFVFAFDLSGGGRPLAQAPAAQPEFMAEALPKAETSETPAAGGDAGMVALPQAEAGTASADAGLTVNDGTPNPETTSAEAMRSSQAITETPQVSIAEIPPSAPDETARPAQAAPIAGEQPQFAPIRWWTLGLGALTAALALITWLVRRK
jgi:hypothetical protein